MSGQLADTGSVSLNKVDSGTLFITGSNTYTGSTTVSGGTLAVDDTGTNTGALGATAVNVVSGASFLARGNTSIASGGSLGIAGGGSLDLRDGQPNTLTVNGNLSLGTGSQGSNVYLELGTGTTDLVNVTGAVSLAGYQPVNISLLRAPASFTALTTSSPRPSGLAASNFTVGSKPAGFDPTRFPCRILRPGGQYHRESRTRHGLLDGRRQHGPHRFRESMGRRQHHQHEQLEHHSRRPH